MNFLIDTNVFYPLEPATSKDLETGTEPAARFSRLTREEGHKVFLHPASERDFEQDSNEERKAIRDALKDKYPFLPKPPPIHEKVKKVFDGIEENSNDETDAKLLSAVLSGAIEYLVTEDRDLLKKARRLGSEDQAIKVREANEMIKERAEVFLDTLPAVNKVYAHELDESDPIFDSLRKDYDEFNEWFDKCKREQRIAWVIRKENGNLAAICMIKKETKKDFKADFGKEGENIVNEVLKISTFKVSEETRGKKYGELLLESAFEHVKENNFGSIYLTIFPDKKGLIWLLEQFGFEEEAEKSNGELVMAKKCSYTDEEKRSYNSWKFHKKFGPKAIKFDRSKKFIVPIKPKWHRDLFPDVDKAIRFQKSFGFDEGKYPFGNAIRKAYLCKSNIRKLNRGDIIYFYLSHTEKAITTIGVIEDLQVSDSPEKIYEFVHERTVYSKEDIEKRAREGEVLAILFRKCCKLDDPISYDVLLEEDVVEGHIQSISSVREGGEEWLVNRTKQLL